MANKTWTVLLTIFGCFVVQGCDAAEDFHPSISIQNLPDETKELERTWDRGLVFIPTSNRFVYGNTWEMLDTAKQLYPNRRLPAIIYMHGCAGINAVAKQSARDFALAGYVVILPNSYARRYKPQSCKLDTFEAGLHRGVLAWRHREAGFAIRAARELAWVDPDNIFLVGLSEGGLTTATYKGEPVNARVIEGWGCHAGWQEYVGMNAPDSEPVLALVAARDPWFYQRVTEGNCGPLLNKNNGSRSIVYAEEPLTNYHWLTWHQDPLREVLQFLDAHRRPSDQ